MIECYYLVFVCVLCFYVFDEFGYFGVVGVDVLDWCGVYGVGNQDEIFQFGQVLVQCLVYEVVLVFVCGYGYVCGVVICFYLYVLCGYGQYGFGVVVGEQYVVVFVQYQYWVSFYCRKGQQFGQFVGVVDFCQQVCFGCYMQCVVVGQWCVFDQCVVVYVDVLGGQGVVSGYWLFCVGDGFF